MDFVKMEGLGNDFVVIEGPPPSTTQIRQWCNRRSGIGADGVLLVARSSAPGVALSMNYWNADGSVAEMCGNGLRCVARYGLNRAWTDGPAFSIETAVGVNRAEIQEGGQVRVELGSFRVEGDVVVDGVTFRCADVGNPHAVTFVDDLAEAPVAELGPSVATNEVFSAGTNVEFVSVTDRGLAMRVWERGVGETQACGTGAAAALAVAASFGRAPASGLVELMGGTLTVELADNTAWITGPANVVYSGQIGE